MSDERWDDARRTLGSSACSETSGSAPVELPFGRKVILFLRPGSDLLLDSARSALSLEDRRVCNHRLVRITTGPMFSLSRTTLQRLGRALSSTSGS